MKIKSKLWLIALVALIALTMTACPDSPGGGSRTGGNNTTPDPTPPEPPPPSNAYIITRSGTSFTATRNGSTVGTANQPIQTVINAIRDHANKANVTIQFGSGGTNTLDTGTASVTFDNSGSLWGTITLTGRITSEAEWPGGTIELTNGAIINSSADIRNTDYFGAAVYNDGGTVTITGGTVSTTGGDRATIYSSKGTLTISGGTVSITDGTAVRSTSESTLTISGGTVSTTDGAAIAISANSTANISGGTVSATTGIAIFSSDGKINISQDPGKITLITSASDLSFLGTIWIMDGDIGELLVISGGTVRNTNTANNRNVIHNESAGDVTISGGRIEKAGDTNYAILNVGGGTLTITEPAIIIGEVVNY